MQSVKKRIAPLYPLFQAAFLLSFSSLFFVFSACSAADESSSSSPLIPEQVLMDAITISDLDGGTSLQAASVDIAYVTDDVTGEAISGIINISNITNICTALPCTDNKFNIGILTLGFLNIASAEDVFMLPNELENIDIAIIDPEGATNIIDVELGSIALTHVSNGEAFTYDIIAHYNGVAVTEFIDNAGGIEKFIDVNVSFDQQQASVNWNDGFLTIANLANIAGNTAVGSVTLVLSDSLLPAGYYMTPSTYSFTDPDGKAATNLEFSEAIVIAEGDDSVDPPTVINDNQVSYNLRINLLATPNVILIPTDLDIAITDTLATTPDITASHLTVDLASLTVFITAVTTLRNFNENILTLNAGTLSLAASANSAVSIDSTDISTTFSDPAGTDDAALQLGTFIASAGEETSTYSLELILLPAYGLLFDNIDAIADRETSAASSYTIAACAKPSSSVFTIDANGATNIINDAQVNINYYYYSASSANNIHNPTLIAGDGSALDFTAAIEVQACDSFTAGTGTASDPWQIDSDIHLDLMSRLVNASDDATHIEYAGDYYTLSADINMGIPEAPWAEASTHPDASTNGFIPIGKTPNPINSYASGQNNQFYGQLNCAPNGTRYNISNLYVSNADARYMGLFGYLTNGARILNCTLKQAKITGEQYVGGIAGLASSSSIIYYPVSVDLEDPDVVAYITNVSLNGNSLLNSTITAEYNIGGIIGGLEGYSYGTNFLSNNTVTNSFVQASLSSAGGIVGKVSSGKTQSSDNDSTNIIISNTVLATSITTVKLSAGGIAGYVIYSNNNGTTIFSDNNTISSIVIASNFSNAGGIAGKVNSWTYLHNTTFSNNSVAYSSISAGISSVGGIVGHVDSYYADGSNTLIMNTVTGGDITAQLHVGSIVGWLSATSAATNTLSQNTVAHVTTTASISNAGGIAGHVSSKNYGLNILTNNNNTNSSIMATSNDAGGIIGSAYNDSYGNTILEANTVLGGSVTINESNVGGIAGKVDSVGANSSSTLSMNIVDGVNIITDNKFAGGLVGRALSRNNASSRSIISNNIITNGSITALYNAGGLLGQADCTSSGKIIISSNAIADNAITSSGNSGGVTGYAYSFKGCTNIIELNTITDNDIIANGERAGGIAGYVWSYNDGSSNMFMGNVITGGVITANKFAGGVVGVMHNLHNDANIITTTFVATTITASNGKAGGLVGGTIRGDISDSFFIGTLSVNSGTVGGALSFIDQIGTINPAPGITNTYAVALIVDTPDSIKGLAPTSKIAVTNSYYDDLLITAAVDSERGESTSALQMPTTNDGIYQNWSADVWNFGTSSQYPVLKDLPATAAEQCKTINIMLETSIDCTYN